MHAQGKGLAVAMLCWATAAAAAGRVPADAPPPANGLAAFELPALTGAPSGPAASVRLVYPVALAARGPDLYVADAGLNRILRYDRARQQFAPFGSLPARSDTRLAVGGDLSLYVLESLDRRVAHYSRNGTLLRTFADDANLGRPVAFAVDEALGALWAADGVYGHLVRFNARGRVADVVRLPPQTLAVGALALGHGGLYVLDAGNAQVLRLSPDARDFVVFVHPALRQAAELASDPQGRIYVSDRANRRLLVLAPGGGADVLPLAHDGTGTMAADEGRLYLADPLRGQVRVFQLAGGR